MLDSWLEAQKVTRLPLAQAQSTIAADGSVRIEQRGRSINAAQAILADDETIAGLVPADVLNGLFQRQPMTTILTEPTLPMAARVMVQIDADLSFVQSGHRGITAIGAGDSDGCAAQVGVLLGANRQLRQAGGARHHGLRSADGAAIVGQMGGAGPILLAGLGATGAFLAPALARLLAGSAKPDEATYFAARSPDRAMGTSIVSEYQPLAPAMVAA